MRMAKRIQDLKITNFLTRELKQDPQTLGDPFKPSMNTIDQGQVYGHYSYVQPTKQPNPITIVNRSFCNEIGLDPFDDFKDFEQVVSGTSLPNSDPYAINYGGHQFGVWAGQLGDGRAITLAQVQTEKSLWELQLKGAGLTPYSRFADGLTMLASSVREYLCAEFMNALGVPTSRSLSLCKTSQEVFREEVEIGGVVCRAAPTWIRFGSFELWLARQDYDMLKSLVDYTICHYFEGLSYTDFAKQVIIKTATMIGKWQAVGFCHGVMNTDNFSVLGLTIDYGPFQFLDEFQNNYICNKSDYEGRYAFKEQPKVGLWNCVRFCNAIHELLKEELGANTLQEKMMEILQLYTPTFEGVYFEEMGKKLGLEEVSIDVIKGVVESLLQLLEDSRMDYSLFFRVLSDTDLTDEVLGDDQLQKWKECSYLEGDKFQMYIPRWRDWYEWYRTANTTSPARRRTLMLSHNPKYILRNHIVNVVIEDAKRGNLAMVEKYLHILQNPFDDHDVEDEMFGVGKVPFSMRGMKCSCTS